MRARSLTLVTCGVLNLGSVLGACASSDGSGGGYSYAGAPAGGAQNAAGAANAAGAGNAAGAPSFPTAGAPSAGAPSFAGAGGGFAQAGSSGSFSAGGASTGGAPGTAGAGGAPGAAGMTGSAGAGGGAPVVPAVKLVVYLDDYTGSWTSWANKIDFTKMTHLNLAFMKATTSNGWASVDGQSDSDIKAIVDKAHAAGVKVLASLGGGGTDSTVVTQYKTPSNDDALVNNLDTFLKKYDIDGADIDIEKESKTDVGDDYGTFVSKVVAKLHPEGKLVTAAVAQYLQPYMNDSTLHLFDFVNIMVYSTNTGDYTSAANFYVGKGMAKTQITFGIISESGQHTSTATTKSITTMSKVYGGAMLWDIAEDTTGTSSVYGAMQSAM